MKDILDIVRPLPSARWVVFYSIGNGAEPNTGRYYKWHRIEHMREPMALPSWANLVHIVAVDLGQCFGEVVG